mgnify:CR=1 FL=1
MFLVIGYMEAMIVQAVRITAKTIMLYGLRH